MKKVLFFIHDLGQGGAEKVLVNLVNNMDTTKFDITVMTLFDVGVNKQFLNDKINYKTCFKRMLRGNSHLMKLFTPRQLHKFFIKEKYDIEIAYLEGPCARIISGCPHKNTKLVSWIHCELHSLKCASRSFRSINETNKCYNKFDKIICVSETVKKDFTSLLELYVPVDVLYNTNESDKIIQLAKDSTEKELFDKNQIQLVGVGKLLTNKGFDRILKITKRLVDLGYSIHTYILGIGSEENNLRNYIRNNNLSNNVTLLGYQTNPYKYVSKCDLFVCASYREGFSTATTEALIVGTPVCTVEVSGMKEMLGENNEYGVVVENNDEALYKAIKELLDNPQLLSHYKEKAIERGKYFSKEKTVKSVEEMLMNL